MDNFEREEFTGWKEDWEYKNQRVSYVEPEPKVKFVPLFHSPNIRVSNAPQFHDDITIIVPTTTDALGVPFSTNDTDRELVRSALHAQLYAQLTDRLWGRPNDGQTLNMAREITRNFLQGLRFVGGVVIPDIDENPS